MKDFIAKEQDDGRNILKYLERMLVGVPKSKIERLFRSKDIKINGKRISDKKTILRMGDKIVVYGVEIEQKRLNIKPAQKTFTVVFEDPNILVVNKKEGVVMSDNKDSLDNQVLNYLNYRPTSAFIPSSIGRLDKVTSGLVIYAKTYKLLKELKAKNNDFVKTYIFRSDLKSSRTTTFKLEHDEDRQREVVAKTGKPSLTEFIVDKNKKTAILKTGRKHQIRASLSKLGFPVFGDRKYGGKEAKRVYLHSYMIEIKNLNDEFKYLNNTKFVSKPKW